jgi:hypothetical protein
VPELLNDQVIIQANSAQESGYRVDVFVQGTDVQESARVGTFIAPRIPIRWDEEKWLTIPFQLAEVTKKHLVLQGETRDDFGCVWRVQDKFTLEGNDIAFHREITLMKGHRNETNVPFAFYAGFQVNESQYPLAEDSYHMIPGMSYNDNPFGEGLYPKNVTKNENQFLFRADRLAIPGQLVSTKDFSLGFYRLNEKLEKGAIDGEQFSVGFMNRSDHHELTFYYPERELNRSYGRKGEWNTPYRKGMSLSEGQTVSSVFYLTVRERKTKHDYADILWSIMSRAKKENRPRQALTLLEAYRKRVEGANKHFWTTAGTDIEEARNTKGWYGHRVNDLDQRATLDILDFRVGFIGRSLMMATETLRLGLETNHNDRVMRATQLIDWFCDQAPTKDGWFFPDYNGKKWFTSWKADSISTRKQAEGVIQLLEAYHLAKSNQQEHPQWLHTAKRALYWLIEHGQEGAYSRWYQFDGSLADPLQTHTPYVITALIKMYQLTGESNYLSEAQKNWEWVVDHIIEPEVYFGGTLDASTEDKEAAIITAEAGVMLFEVTQDYIYLEGAKKACDQVLSYMMMYNITFPKGTSLEQQGFQTFGTTLVSPENNHIDPYTTSALIKVGVYSGDMKYAQAGVANLQATTQDISSELLQREIWYQGPWWYFDQLGKGNAQPWSVGWSQILAASVYKEVAGIFISHESQSGIGIDGCHLHNLHFSEEHISFVCEEQLGVSRQIEILIPDIRWNQAQLTVNDQEQECYSKEQWFAGYIKIRVEENQSVKVVINK